MLKDASDISFKLLISEKNILIDEMDICLPCQPCAASSLRLPETDNAINEAESSLGQTSIFFSINPSVLIHLFDQQQALQPLQPLRQRQSSLAAGVSVSASKQQSSQLCFSCELHLEYQSTLINVSGQVLYVLPDLNVSDCDDANAQVDIEFQFDDPKSMQAKMILQLVKICQMRSQLELESSCDLQKAAKKWTETFASDFAREFELKP